MSRVFVALRVIFTDPINLSLALIPTLIALSIYLLVLFLLVQNVDTAIFYLQNYIPDYISTGWVGKFLTLIFAIFVFFMMSWTFVLAVGVIAAPFNSMLSSRIESHLTGRTTSSDRKKTFTDILAGLRVTFTNEFQKIALVALLTAFALFLNFIPLFYPISLLILSLLFAVQFIDYSWSRHDYHPGQCWSDVRKNLLPYTASGFVFLLMLGVPLLNSLIPAFATSYYTVLWVERQKRIN